MASTAFDLKDVTPRGSIARSEKSMKDETPIAHGVRSNSAIAYTASDDSLKPIFDDTHRKLKPRHIQLIGIGGYAPRPGPRLSTREANHLGIGQLALRFSSRLVDQDPEDLADFIH